MSTLTNSQLRSFASTWEKRVSQIKSQGKVDIKTFNNKVWKEFFASKVLFHSPAFHKGSTDPQYIKQILTWVVDIVDGFYYKNMNYFDEKQGRVAMVFGGKRKDPKTGEKTLLSLPPPFHARAYASASSQLSVCLNSTNRPTIHKNRVFFVFPPSALWVPECARCTVHKQSTVDNPPPFYKGVISQ